MGGAPGGNAAPLACAVRCDQRMPEFVVFHDALESSASIWARSLLPSIGPTFVTASAPAAVARRIASAKLNAPVAQSVTKVAQKQSAAPVGSRTSALWAGKVAPAPALVRPSARLSPFFSTAARAPPANNSAA